MLQRRSAEAPTDTADATEGERVAVPVRLLRQPVVQGLQPQTAGPDEAAGDGVILDNPFYGVSTTDGYLDDFDVLT